MADKAEKIGFDDVPESKQYKSITKGGVHRKFHLEEVEYVERKEKTKKEKDGTETGTGEFVGPYVRFVFQNEETQEVFTTMMFEPATREEDVKFLSDFYDKGVKTRKKTPAEQIKHEFTQRFYFYEQLAKAWIVSPEKFDIFKRSLVDEPPVLFKKMYKSFFEAFPLDKIKGKLIDLKVMYKNDDIKKTSFLQLCYPGANNLVFAPHIENRDTMLSVTQSEQKSLSRKYSNTDRAPSSNDTEVIPTEGGWKAVETGGEDAADDKPLF